MNFCVLLNITALLWGPLAPERQAQAWCNELDSLAAQTQEALAHPLARRFAHDRSYECYLENLAIAAAWPRPEFRSQLSDGLGSNDPIVILHCARGLLHYHDDRLRSRVDGALLSVRPCNVGGSAVPVQDQIELALLEYEAGQRLRSELLAAPLDGMLDKSAFRQLCGIRQMTVPVAVRALSSDDWGLQIAAFSWLDNLGIVLDARVLERHWTQIPDAELAEIMAHRRIPKLGQHKLRQVLECLVDAGAGPRMPEVVYGSCLVRLAQLGSQKGHDVAVDIITEHVASLAPSTTAPLPELVLSAFDAMAAAPSSGDVGLLLSWCKHHPGELRDGALGVLACIDDSRATRAVLAELELVSRSLCSSPNWHRLSPWMRLQYRAWPTEEYKCQYLRRIGTLLQEQTSALNASALQDAWLTITLVETLEAIGQTSNGWHGLALPGAFDHRAAQETSLQWAEWINANCKGAQP